MAMPLTDEQLAVLRAVPPEGTGTRNRLRIAIALTGAKQMDIAEETGIPQSNLSGIVTGRQAGMNLQTAQKLATFFGCTTDDLFPAAAKESVA